MKDGGPAFPFVEPSQQCSVAVGMSLRDYFAAKALSGMNVPDGWDIKDSERVCRISVMAVTAYEIADAMLAERDKKCTISDAA